MSAVLRFSPRVGRPWAGGVFAGVIDDHRVIAGPLMGERATWADATAWAAAHRVNGFSDFTLPALAELRLLDEVFPNLFSPEAWWSREPHPASAADALVLHFGAGLASHWGRHHHCRALAVRCPSNYL